MTLRYINTDLDLVSDGDLAVLAGDFEARGLISLHVERGSDRLWRARFETKADPLTPEQTIGAMLGIVENASAAMLRDWERCAFREFNIGFDSGRAPRVIEQGLSNDLLRRIADVGARIGITIYATEMT